MAQFSDRVKDTSITVGTGTITLANSAPIGFQTFAVGLPASSTVPYCISSQTTAEWEVGNGVLLTSTTLSRSPTASSNAGGLVNFSAGTKDVFCTLPADILRRGMVDPTDIGFDIVLCAGQSNMVGLGSFDSTVDVADSRVFSFPTNSATAATYQKIMTGVDPLTFNAEVSIGIGPATWFAKSYSGATPTNRKVLLVPVATGGTYLVHGTPQWGPGSPGGTLYEMSIAQANAAIVSAKKMYPASRFAGVIWLQGESDGDFTVATADYATALKTLIAGFRTRITGATKSFFIIGGMVPEAITARNYGTINVAHIQVANETSRCVFVPGTSGNQNGDNLHYNGTGQRYMGCAMGVAAYTAQTYSGVDTTAPTISSVQVTNASPLVVSLAMSEPLDSAYAPAATAFAISGHVVSSVVISGSAINITVSAAFVNGEAARTVTYTQPATNGARDLTGNLLATTSAIAITNNVGAVASSITLTGPSIGSTSTASSAFTVALAPVGSTATGTIVVTPSDSAGGGTFSPTTVSLTTAAPTATFTYTPNATAGAKSISLTNNGGLTNPAALTYTTSAAAVTIRFSPLINMLESGSNPYIYTTQGSTYGAAQGGVSTTSLAGNGSITIKLGNATGKPMLRLQTSTAVLAFGGAEYNLFANTGGYESGTSSIAASSTANPGIIFATNDLNRLTRTGATVVAEVSKDSGTTWSTISTWSSVPAGVLYASITSEGNQQHIAFAATGFA